MLSQRVDDDIELFLLMPHHAREFLDLVNANREFWGKWHLWVEDVTDENSAAVFIQRGLEMLSDGTSTRLGLRYCGKLAGQTMSMVDTRRRKLEIAYQLDEGCTGKGVMTRAVRAIISNAFRELKMQKVEIYCSTLNPRSRAIPERLGFQQEGIIRRGDEVNGVYHDLVIYGMLAEEWKSD